MDKIFISHAVADKELVDVFVDFLQTGCGVSLDHIFCSSLEGVTIPEGSSFVEFMENTLREAVFVIMIITPSYYESVFCLCELGATWILKHNNFPLLVPPLDWSDLKAVLTPRHGGKINDTADLANLFDRLKAIGIGSMATARFGLKKDAFIEKLKTLKIKGKTSVSAKEHEELKAKYDAAVKSTIEYDNEIAKLKKQFEELAAKKDAADVRDVLLADSNEPERWEILVRAFNAAAESLPDAALEAMFSEERNENYCLPLYFANEHIHDSAQNAAERQFIKIDGNAVSLNSDHPSVSAAVARLGELRKFMSKASEPFTNKYEGNNKHPFSIRNRDFWEENLGL